MTVGSIRQKRDRGRLIGFLGAPDSIVICG